MKKQIFFGLTIAASVGFASAYKSSRPSLSPRQLENIEALSVPEFAFDEYDMACSEGHDICVFDPITVFLGTPKN